MFASALTCPEGTPTVAVCRFGTGIVVQMVRPAADLLPRLPPGTGGFPPNRTGRGGSHKTSRLRAGNFKGKTMSLGTILLIVLILMLIGVIPTWPHSRSWGYWPSGALGVVVIIILILLVTGRL